nr:unnamed protein product [Callosobruchus analis]
MLKTEQISTTKKLHILEREFKMCNLRIFNLAETDGENTAAVVLKLLNSKMSSNLVMDDILKTSLRNVWSSRGNIFVVKGDVKIMISCEQDLGKL